LENAEYKFQTEKKKIIDEYEAKSKATAGTIEKDLRKELDTVRRNAELAEQKHESEKKRITDDYERKLGTAASNQEK